jgi:hypothetical protein
MESIKATDMKSLMDSIEAISSYFSDSELNAIWSTVLSY